MSEKTTEQLQRYVDAAKIDILELLNKPSPNIYEFRRIASLCDIVSSLCDAAAAGFISPRAIHEALWGSENLAPTLHAALGGHVFDADELLKAKYESMSAMHTDMRRKLSEAKIAERDYERARRSLDYEMENVVLEQAAVAAERQLLAGRSQDLEQRELALSAGEEKLKQLSSGDAAPKEHVAEPVEPGEAPP